jgi:hypothetical protein
VTADDNAVKLGILDLRHGRSHPTGDSRGAQISGYGAVAGQVYREHP